MSNVGHLEPETGRLDFCPFQLFNFHSQMQILSLIKWADYMEKEKETEI